MVSQPFALEAVGPRLRRLGTDVAGLEAEIRYSAAHFKNYCWIAKGLKRHREVGSSATCPPPESV